MRTIATLAVPPLDKRSELIDIATAGAQLMLGFKGPVGDGRHGGFVVYDMANPSSPARIGEPRHRKKPWVTIADVAFAGTRPLLADARGVRAVDPHSDEFETLSSCYGTTKLCGWHGGAVAFDGYALTVLRGGEETTWKVPTQRGESMARPAVAPGGSLLAAPCRDRMFRVIDLASGEVAFKRRTIALITPAFHPDGSQIAFGAFGDRDPEVHVVDTATWKHARWTGPLEGVSSLAYSSDGSKLYGLASHLGTDRPSAIHVWDTSDASHSVWECDHREESLMTMAVGDGWLAVGGEPDVVTVLSAD